MPQTRSAAEQKAQKKAAGFCISGACPTAAAPGHVYCEMHLANLRDITNASNARKRALGLCTRRNCQVPSATWYCPAHQRQHPPCSTCGSKEHTKVGHKKLDLCHQCGKPATGRHHQHRYCDTHLAAMIQGHRKVERVTRAEALRKGLCGRCRKRPRQADSLSRCTECLAYAATHERGRTKAARAAKPPRVDGATLIVGLIQSMGGTAQLRDLRRLAAAHPSTVTAWLDTAIERGQVRKVGWGLYGIQEPKTPESTS